MIKKQTIADAWKSFSEDVIPADAPPVQFEEMRKAFYAGAWTAICAFKDLGEPGVPEHEAIAQMEALSQECDNFVTLMSGVSRN